MLSGTRPFSIRKLNVSSAAFAATIAMLVAPLSRNRSAHLTGADTIGDMARPGRKSPGWIRLNVRDAIEHPTCIVGRREQCWVAQCGPHQPSEIVGETGDRIPCRRGPRI